jgi:hypothetical protein
VHCIYWLTELFISRNFFFQNFYVFDSSFISCIALFHSAVYLYSLRIHLFMSSLMWLIILTIILLSFLYHFSIISVHWYGIVDCWILMLPWVLFVLLFSCVLCFCVEICTSEAKTLVRNFYQLQYFSWSIPNVQAGLCNGSIEVLFLTTGLSMWLSSQALTLMLREPDLIPSTAHI